MRALRLARVPRALEETDGERRPMFRVRPRGSAGEGQARMLVHDRGAKLEMRVRDEKSGTSEDLPLDLRRGSRWQAGAFEDGTRMAQALYQHMTQRLAAAADGAI